MVEADVDAVDINLGCPQGIAKRGHYGAFLQVPHQPVSSYVVNAYGGALKLVCR